MIRIPHSYHPKYKKLSKVQNDVVYLLKQSRAGVGAYKLYAPMNDDNVHAWFVTRDGPDHFTFIRVPARTFDFLSRSMLIKPFLSKRKGERGPAFLHNHHRWVLNREVLKTLEIAPEG